MFKSKYGFHPCDYNLFLKLKRLYKAFWEGKKILARHERWARKLPENRRGSEPKVPPVYHAIVASPIVEEFQMARHGVEKQEMVKPLKIPLVQINAWVQALEEYSKAA